MEQRVNHNELGFSDEYVYVLNDVPFTGMVYDDATELNGWIRSEIPMVNGKCHGVGRAYFMDGSLHIEANFEHGQSCGIEREWYEDGALKMERIWDHDKVLSSKTWSNDGVLIEEYSRNSDGDFIKVV